MKNLLKEEFTCEIITPMFLGGADGANQYADPEIRPPSIRGGMRWWFRAMMGGLMGNNIKGLKKAEEYVFGSPDKSSSVVIKTTGNPKATSYARLPHKKGNESAPRKAFIQNGIFNITLSLSPYIRQNEEEIFNCAKYSLLLLISFGGLGTRSRRGFGSVHLLEELDYLKLFSETQVAFIKLSAILEIENKGWTVVPSFPCLSKEYFKLWVSKTYDTLPISLYELMNNMHLFIITHEKEKYAIGGVQGRNRQVSPLIVHTLKVADEKIKLLFSHFFTSPMGQLVINKEDMVTLESFIKEKFELKRLEVFV